MSEQPKTPKSARGISGLAVPAGIIIGMIALRMYSGEW